MLRNGDFHRNSLHMRVPILSTPVYMIYHIIYGKALTIGEIQYFVILWAADHSRSGTIWFSECMCDGTGSM